MNFFTKPWSTEYVKGIACGLYKPSIFHNEGEPFIFLDMLKFKNSKKPCDHMLLIGGLFTQPGCDEGLILIQSSLEIYLKELNKIPQDFQFNLLLPEVRIKVFRDLAVDPAFIRNELRLKLIEIIEGLR